MGISKSVDLFKMNNFTSRNLFPISYISAGKLNFLEKIFFLITKDIISVKKCSAPKV